jgi:large subunit ribosomal protein L32
MAKHPVPKKKTCKRASRQRYGSFKTKVLKRMEGILQLVKCSNCQALCLSHRVCQKCGFYRGRQVLDIKSKSKVTKIKA